MRNERCLRGRTTLAAYLLATSSAITGCGGGADPSPASAPPPLTTNPAPTITAIGTGTLVVQVSDPEGRPLADAHVDVFNPAQTAIVGTAATGTTGVATVDSVPAAALVYVHHAFGESYRNQSVAVAQQGVTHLAVTLQPARPKPTVALLPVTIAAGSISADRSELTLQITIVASTAAPFVPAGYGDYSPSSTPSLGLALGKFEDVDPWRTPRHCFVWLDRMRTAPSCGPWGESPYTVSVSAFTYAAAGIAPMLPSQSATRSTMLVLDQSERVAALDPGAARSFGARRLIARAVASAELAGLSVAGIARDGGVALSLAALPERPLWVPLPAGAVFSKDHAALDAAVSLLQPLVGGVPAVFAGLEAALTLTAQQAAPGNGAVIALLGGGDDSGLVESARQAALASLEQRRNDARVQTVLIAAAPIEESAERWALAELAAALRAPVISLGVSQTWEAGSFAALDLAADLVDSRPLPALSAELRVKTERPEGFLSGETLHGIVFVESEVCPMGCWEIPLEFAVETP